MTFDFVKPLVYAAYIAGVLLWQYPLIYRIKTIVRSRLKIHRSLKAYTDSPELRRRNAITRHIKMSVEASDMGRFFKDTDSFYAFSFVLMAGAGVCVSFAAGIKTGIMFGIFVGLLPYLIVVTKLHSSRVSRSREGDILVQELLNNYKICGYNMKEAVEATSYTINDAPHAKKLILNLARGLNEAASEDEVSQELAKFRYSVDTAWGNALAVNIYFAHIFGIRVDFALEDLLKSIVSSRNVIEHSKRANNEANIMLKYMAPCTYLISIAGACRFFGFSIGRFVKYQFATALGIRWFILMTMIYVIGILVNAFLSSEKMDI